MNSMVPRRCLSLDSFRGFAVASMIGVNFLGLYAITPPFLKHAKGEGLTFADLVAPLFLFVLGIMYRKSLMRRIGQEGWKKAFLSLVRRYGLLLLIGMAGGSLAKGRLTFDWGILQAIGLAGIIALPLMTFSAKFRVLALGLLSSAYSTLLTTPLRENILRSEHGGVFGSLGWGIIIMIASLAGDLLKNEGVRENSKRIFLLGSGLLITGFFISFIIPISKSLVSPSYAFLSAGLAAMLLIPFLILGDGLRISIPVLHAMGKNAL